MTANYDEDTKYSESDVTIHENVNPYRYIDITMQRISAALTKENAESGFFQFIVLVNKLEAECKGLKLIGSDYEEEIKKIKEEEKGTNQQTKDIRVANRKYGLLFQTICGNQTITDPLIVTKKM